MLLYKGAYLSFSFSLVVLALVDHLSFTSSLDTKPFVVVVVVVMVVVVIIRYYGVIVSQKSSETARRRILRRIDSAPRVRPNR